MTDHDTLLVRVADVGEIARPADAYEAFQAEAAGPARPPGGAVRRFLADLWLMPRIWREQVGRVRADVEDERVLDLYLARRAADPTFEPAILACQPYRLSPARNLKTRADRRACDLARRGFR